MNNFRNWLQLQEKIVIGTEEFRDMYLALEYLRQTHARPESLVVTYTNVDKVGINPKSKYNTPLGIYFYPLDYVLERNTDKSFGVPFAGDSPYLNVCELVPYDKILHMRKSEDHSMGMDNPKLKLMPGYDEIIEKINRSKNGYFGHEDTVLYLDRSNYSELWVTTMLLSGYRNSIKWNKVFRDLGIPGFIDHGTGTIHMNEPTQGVVFSASNLKRIMVIQQETDRSLGRQRDRKDVANRHSVKQSGSNIKPDKMPDDRLIEFIKTHRYVDINTLVSRSKDHDRVLLAYIKNKDTLPSSFAKTVLEYGKDNKKIVEALSPEQWKSMEPVEAILLLNTYDDMDFETVVEKIGKDKLQQINEYQIRSVLDDAVLYRNKIRIDRFLKFLIQAVDWLLSRKTIIAILMFSKNKLEIANLLGEENISSLYGDADTMQPLILGLIANTNNSNVNVLENVIKSFYFENMVNVDTFLEQVPTNKLYIIDAILPILRKFDTKKIIRWASDDFPLLEKLHEVKIISDEDFIINAIKKEEFASVADLIKKGVAISSTALSTAAKVGNLPFIKYLVSKGVRADKDILISAVASKKLDVVKYFVEEVGLNDIKYLTSGVNSSVFEGQLEMLKYFVSKLPEDFLQGTIGHYNLFSAISSGLFHIVKYLIEKGVNTHLAYRKAEEWRRYDIMNYFKSVGITS